MQKLEGGRFGRELAKGAESTVYLSTKGSIIKLYRSLDLASIMAYQGLTNAASTWLNQNPHSYGIALGGSPYIMNARITPIQTVIPTQEGVITFSDYIPGPPLNLFTRGKEDAAAFTTITDEREKEFLLRILSQAQSNKDLRASFFRFLHPLVSKLERATGVRGFLFPGINVKVGADLEQGIINFMVTDITDIIKDLKFLSD